MRNPALLAAIVTGAVAVVVLVITLLFAVDLTGEFFEVLVPITADVGDATASDIEDGSGNAFVVMALGVLSIPAALLLAALVGGRGNSLAHTLGREPPRPPRSGGPF